jgi:formylglycine-generating enzyme required for sulfatase activity
MNMKKIADAVGSEFELMDPPSAEHPRFIHKASGISFQFVPGGEYAMGFSDDEERAARFLSPVLQLNLEEMRPVQRRVVGPLLVSLTPVLNKQIHNDAQEYRDYPAFLNHENARQFAERLGCRLPKEAEWEYLCRAGTSTLFPFGDQLPPDDELEKWLSSDFESLERLRCNSFGLYGMSNPEWCQDKFTVSLAEGASLFDGSYVVRGGGAYFWPWQDEEWVWCASAMRSPSSALEDDEACLRLVRDISFDDVS